MQGSAAPGRTTGDDRATDPDLFRDSKVKTQSKDITSIAWFAARALAKANEDEASRLKNELSAARAHLGAGFESLAIPRAWRFFRHLPSNAQGKLPQSLFDAAAGPRPGG